jgi:hypothetical protein
MNLIAVEKERKLQKKIPVQYYIKQFDGITFS